MQFASPAAGFAEKIIQVLTKVLSLLVITLVQVTELLLRTGLTVGQLVSNNKSNIHINIK